MSLLFAFTKIFAFNDDQITKCQKLSSREDESSKGLHCLKKHVLSTNFRWRQKRGAKNFIDGKRIWKTLG